ncbi:MAG: hypothetical protein CMC13_14840 [Flavobacteriaceae bacterium]|nr:hypothetical protein [Flavobacteriaceae bacterium]
MLVILKLLFAGFIGIQTAGIIVVAVVIFLAIGNPFAKLAIILIGIYLFVKSYTGMNVQAFEFLLVQVGVLALVLVGLYIMIKSMFR